MTILVLVIIEVIGMGIALTGFSILSGEGITTGARLIAWGFAVCMTALTIGLRVLQKQIDELKSDKVRRQSSTEDAQQTQDVQHL